MKEVYLVSKGAGLWWEVDRDGGRQERKKLDRDGGKGEKWKKWVKGNRGKRLISWEINPTKQPQFSLNLAQF